MVARAEPPPWVIVAGGFHQHGGMDRANAALASHLLETGREVHLVGHDIDPAFERERRARVHVVARPRGFPGLAERMLGRRGGSVARAVVAANERARVVVNGGNCPWPDINWVHAVHAAWPVCDDGAPWWSRSRARRLKDIAVARERKALRSAAVVVANSETTRRTVIEQVGVPSGRARTVYLGSNPDWGVPDARERAEARAWLDLPPQAPVVVFVGALGNDINKGFDLLWRAWSDLARAGSWDAQLVVAGGGWRASRWQQEAGRTVSGGQVRFLGFTPKVRQVLAAGDLLVSPVRYEAYGLNVHEALCRGLAVMVTGTAGVAERFDGAMSPSLLPRGATPEQIAQRLREWRADVDGWRARAAPTAARLRARTWEEMAEEFVAAVTPSKARATA